MYEVKHTIQEKVWERFLEAERWLLEARQEGSLAREMGKPVPGESLEELRWLAIEDQHMAETGLVELRRGEEAWYKHIYDLVREERPARIEAESARTAWLMERLRKSKATGSDGRGEI
jgi:hypothetical protein